MKINKIFFDIKDFFIQRYFVHLLIYFYGFFCLTSKTGTAVVEVISVCLLPFIFKNRDKVLKRAPRSYKAFFIFFSLTLLSSVIVCVRGDAFWGDLSRLRHHIALLILGACFFIETSEKRDFNRFFNELLLFVCAGVVAGGLKSLIDYNIMYFGGGGFELLKNKRFGGFTGTNVFGYCVGGLFPFCFYGLLSHFRKRQKIFYCFLVTIFMAFISIYLEQSRGPILILLISFPLVSFFHNRKLSILLMIFSFLSLSLIVALIATNKIEIDSRIFQSFKSDSNMIRVSQFEVSKKIVSLHPILGIGLRSFRRKSGEFKKKYDIAFPEFESHSHSTFTHIAAENGIPVFLAFVFFLFLLFREILPRTHDDPLIPCFSAVLLFCIASLYDHMYIRQFAVCFNIIALFSWSNTSQFMEKIKE